MFEMLELILEVLPDVLSIGDVLRSARDGHAEFEQKLGVMTATTLAQRQRQGRLRPTTDEHGASG